jgi:hypothetical protein
MNTQSRVIFKGAHYTACVVQQGTILTVQSNRTGKGKAIRLREVGNDFFQNWVNVIENAIDKKEGHALCSGFLQA